MLSEKSQTKDCTNLIPFVRNSRKSKTISTAVAAGTVVWAVGWASSLQLYHDAVAKPGAECLANFSFPRHSSFWKFCKSAGAKAPPSGICSTSSKATWSSSGGHCLPEDIFSAPPPTSSQPCLLWPPSKPVLKSWRFPFSFRFRSLKKTTTISFVSLRNCRLRPQTARRDPAFGRGREPAAPRRRFAFRSLRLHTTTPGGSGRLQALAASFPRLSSVSFEGSDS